MRHANHEFDPGDFRNDCEDCATENIEQMARNEAAYWDHVNRQIDEARGK